MIHSWFVHFASIGLVIPNWHSLAHASMVNACPYFSAFNQFQVYCDSIQVIFMFKLIHDSSIHSFKSPYNPFQVNAFQVIFIHSSSYKINLNIDLIHTKTSNSIHYKSLQMFIHEKIQENGNFYQMLTLLNNWHFGQLWPKSTYIFPRSNPTCSMWIPYNPSFISTPLLMLLHEQAMWIPSNASHLIYKPWSNTSPCAYGLQDEMHTINHKSACLSICKTTYHGNKFIP